jgi:hypothetical protein
MKVFYRTNPFLPRQSVGRCRPLCRAIIDGVAPMPRWKHGAQLHAGRAMHHGAALHAAAPLCKAPHNKLLIPN